MDEAMLHSEIVDMSIMQIYKFKRLKKLQTVYRSVLGLISIKYPHAYIKCEHNQFKTN